MDTHIIAIATYGSHRVKHPHTGQMISAYKLGYTSAASAVLLALYGHQAQDVSSKHASYHYVQILSDTTVRHGYILLKVNDDELTRAESITIQNHRPAVYRWLDGAWQEFPNKRSAHYQAIIGHSGPNFNPTGMLIVSASTGEVESAVAGITAEKSQRSATDTPWWWIRGDTYPHRDLLKLRGCRWSKRQKAWYFIGHTLPDAVQALIDVSSHDDAPCSDEEAERILGVKLQSKRQSDEPAPTTPAAAIPDEPPAEADKPQAIRIIKPMSDGAETDAVNTAIRQTKAETLPSLSSSAPIIGKRSLVRIPQAPCGELTGSISGNVWCYGYAVHDGVCIYLNMGGPRMAVVRAPRHDDQYRGKEV